MQPREQSSLALHSFHTHGITMSCNEPKLNRIGWLRLIRQFLHQRSKSGWPRYNRGLITVSHKGWVVFHEWHPVPCIQTIAAQFPDTNFRQPPHSTACRWHDVVLAMMHFSKGPHWSWLGDFPITNFLLNSGSAWKCQLAVMDPSNSGSTLLVFDL